MILSNISVPLMGLADTAMLGHLADPSYLGAVAIGANIIALLYWVFAFLRMGTTSSTAQAVGANNTPAIMTYLRQNAFLAVSLGTLLIAFQSLILPGLVWLITPEDTLLDLALEYCSIRIYSAPAVLLTYVAMGWLIGLSKPKSALVVTVSANLLNITLDYYFIVVLDWNVRGAAYATLIAEYFSCFAILCCALLQAYQRRWLRQNITTSLDFERLKASLLQGADLFVRTLSLLGVINFFNAQSAQLGTDVLAANAIVFQCTLFVAHFLDGYALAGETMTAEAIGARRVNLFHRASLAISSLGVLIAICLSMFFLFFGLNVVSLMTDIDSVRNAIKHYLPWLTAMPLISVSCYMLDGIFIGAGRTRTMRNSMLFSTFGVFLPSWWAFQIWGNHGLWLAFALFNLSRAATLGVAYWQISNRQLWLFEHKNETT